jgi:hypothetical protein
VLSPPDDLLAGSNGVARRAVLPLVGDGQYREAEAGHLDASDLVTPLYGASGIAVCQRMAKVRSRGIRVALNDRDAAGQAWPIRPVGVAEAAVAAEEDD